MDEYMLVMAEALAQSEVAAGVERARSKLPKQPVDFDGLCVECNEEIHPQRVRFGATTCLPCQQEIERGDRNNRRGE